MRKLALILSLFFVLSAASCETQQQPAAPKTSSPDFKIVAGSENSGLEPMIAQWGRQNGKRIAVNYKGSVDISRCLERGKACDYDAVWPANSLWITMGDTQAVVKHAKSILRSPVALGLKCSKVKKLGWDKKPVTVADILNAAKAGEFRLAMTSATQSNSGTSAYIGALYAMAGKPDMLTMEHLKNADVQARVKDFLSQVDRGSGSSGWLKDALVENPNRFDAMFNYEAMIIEANRGLSGGGQHTQGLIERGQEPLCVVYPSDGLMVADSPLGYVDHGDPAKEKIFQALQQHLLSQPAQEQLKAEGRRTGLIGLDVQNVDNRVFNPAWGIDVTRDISPVPTPEAEVIRAALNMYQTGLRKPSLTIWALDVSGSMRGKGIEGLKQAMTNLLDPKIAEANLLQAGERDVTVIIPFNNEVVAVWKMEGNKPEDLANMLRNVQGLQANGGTDMYSALIKAMGVLQVYDKQGTLWNYLPAIVAMTDGASDRGNQKAFLNMLNSLPFGKDVPIYSISFGEADERQLKELSSATVGRLFDSKGDLSDALRSAKGYN